MSSRWIALPLCVGFVVACGSSGSTDNRVDPDGKDGGGTGNGETGGTAGNGGTSGTGAMPSSGGGTNGGNGAGAASSGGSNAGGSRGGEPITCVPGAAKSGVFGGLTDLSPGVYANDVAASCDGSFAAVGQADHGITFTKTGGARIALPTARVWVARFDQEGMPAWAGGIVTGEIDEAQYAYLDAFSDGSVVVAGNFGTSATFDSGGPSETTLTGDTPSPEGYVARYSGSGAFQWARQLGSDDYTVIQAVAAGHGGVTYAAVATTRRDGTTIGTGEIDLKLAGGEGAVVALDAAGHFVHATRYAATAFGGVRLKALPDGGVLFYGESGTGLVLAKGAPEQAAASSSAFSARFKADLTLAETHALPDSVPLYATTMVAFSDGSVAFASPFDGGTLTLGAGTPRATTLTATKNLGVVVGRYDPEGKLEWATNLGSNDDTGGQTQAQALATLGDDSLWVGGSYRLTAVTTTDILLAPGTAGQKTIHVAGRYASYFARFASDGKPAWGSVGVGTSVPRTIGIAASESSLVVLGQFQDALDFGGQTFTAASGADVFLARFGN